MHALVFLCLQTTNLEPAAVSFNLLNVHSFHFQIFRQLFQYPKCIFMIWSGRFGQHCIGVIMCILPPDPLKSPLEQTPLAGDMIDTGLKSDNGEIDPFKVSLAGKQRRTDLKAYFGIVRWDRIQ